MRQVIAFLAGGVFGTGLLISGMTNTLKVQAWLDVFGDWDPTLAFVMGGAILPMAIAWRIAERRKISAVGTAFPAPADPKIDPKLAIGSVLFGAGWGLSGLCPGPAIASATFGGLGGLIFLLSMAAGMKAAVPVRRWIEPAQS